MVIVNISFGRHSENIQNRHKSFVLKVCQLQRCEVGSVILFIAAMRQLLRVKCPLSFFWVFMQYLVIVNISIGRLGAIIQKKKKNPSVKRLS